MALMDLEMDYDSNYEVKNNNFCNENEFLQIVPTLDTCHLHKLKLGKEIFYLQKWQLLTRCSAK